MKNTAEIIDELKELSPVLLSIKAKDIVPIVPASYFSNLSDNVISKIVVVKELQDISPAIADLKIQDGKPRVLFSYFENLEDEIIPQLKIKNISNKKYSDIPDGYFELLADNVLNKIKKEEDVIAGGKLIPLQASNKNKIVKLFSHLAIAASLIGIIFLGIKNLRHPSTADNCEDGIACLTQEEIFNYMKAHSSEFDVQQVQEATSPMIEEGTRLGIEHKEAAHYIEQHENILDADDAATDIF
jgi:hypothetical protein